MSTTDDLTATDDASLPDWSLAGIALATVVLQVVLFVFMVARYDPETVPETLSASIPLTSGVAGLVIGYDATRLTDAGTWWHPRPWAWAFAMLPPGLNLGFCVGYLLRRREAVTESVPDDRWLRLLVAALVVAYAGSGVVRLFGEVDPDSALLLALVVVFLLSPAAFALSIVALYYDLLYANAVLSTADHRWPLKGYHWIPLVLGTALLVVFYYFRRRMLLGRVEETPADLLESEWRSVDIDEP